jgi:peptidoglycan/xylan/chitin deacetylase (PgdA/CDA1 family)
MSNFPKSAVYKSLIVPLIVVCTFFYDISRVMAKTGSQGEIGMSAIPVLCYHQVRNWKSADSKSDRIYILPVNTFREQIKSLRNNGYHVILPDQLVDYFEKGAQLPEHPVLLTFDDGTESQYLNALPELDAADFKAVFFIMTAVLDHSPFMSRNEVVDLSRRGHIIACHTWDHHSVKGYNASDWIKQVKLPREELERIIGKSVKYFAYPYGAWSPIAISKIEQLGFTAAFQLWGKCDKTKPIYTIRRILVSGYWTSSDLLNAIRKIEK